MSGTYGFDNVLLSMFTIFQMVTLEGWTDAMYMVKEAARTYSFDVFFLIIVVLGAMVILNLMVAVQSSFLDQAFDEEESEIKERENKEKMKQRHLEEQNLQFDEEDNENCEECQNDASAEVNKEEQKEEHKDDNHEQNNPGEPSHKGKRKLKQKKRGLCTCKLPQVCVRVSSFFETFFDAEHVRGIFVEKVLIVLILINTFFMAVQIYEQPEALEKACDYANLFFTVIFLLEMIAKMIGLGFKKYFSEGFNIFDCFIVVMSYVELIMSARGGGGSLSVLRAFRLLRIFKIVKSWKSLRILLSTVLESLTAIMNLAILILLYLFISALLLKQFYSGQLYDSDGEESRYSFSTTGDALVTVFIILTGENWNEPMVQVISKWESFAPAPLFIAITMLGNWMLLNLFLAILLKALSKEHNEDDKKEAEIKKEEEIRQSQVQPAALEQNVTEQDNLKLD